MIWLVSRLRHDFRTWDGPTKVGFSIALLLLGVTGLLFVSAPDALRQSICLGAAALLAIVEALVMWGNRGMISPLTRAQRAYMRGDFDQVIEQLEALRAAGSSDYRALTLLGNTFRQLGRLDESARVLSEAVDKSPDHHYSLYGYGRTLIVQGRYQEAVTLIEKALAQGAPEVIRFDLAEAQYRAGQHDAARASLSMMDSASEPYRLMMRAFWRAQLGIGEAPSRAAIAAGLPYWAAQAERFAGTPYGAVVASEVRQLQSLLNEEVSDGSSNPYS